MSHFDDDDEKCALQSLVGKRVSSLELSDGQGVLVVGHDSGESIFVTSTECCEATWISDIIGVQCLLGQTVLKVENLLLPDLNDGRDTPPGEDPEEQDETYSRGCVQHYGIKLETTGGIVDIIFRTNSNGCYGGKLEDAERPREWFESRGKFEKLTEDFAV
jgi:hypothetical protein